MDGGSAIPMRGKSRTCRRHTPKFRAVYDREGSQTRCQKKRLSDRQVEDLPRIGLAKPAQRGRRNEFAYAAGTDIMKNY